MFGKNHRSGNLRGVRRTRSGVSGPNPRPVFQSLEPRKLLSAVLDGGLLTLTATERSDKIFIMTGENAGEVRVKGIEGVEPDTLFSGVNAIRISSFDGNDKISIEAGLRNMLGDLYGVEIDGGEGNNKITAGSGDDHVVVGNGNNKIFAEAGDDLIEAGSGKNKVFGSEGDDDISVGAGQNKIEGEAGDDHIRAREGNDKIHGGLGDDSIEAGTGRNKVWGDDGDDEISTGDDNDKIDGGEGDDLLVGGNGDNKVKGRGGDDRIYTGSGRDKIDGGDGDDTVDHGSGDDKSKNHESVPGSIGFWHSNHGQSLLLQLNGGPDSMNLGNWLASNFSNIYGSGSGEADLTGATNTEVAAIYQKLFDRSGKDRDQLGLSASPKFDAKVLATALDVYVTTRALAGNVASGFGFNVTDEGFGVVEFSVGDHGLAFGVDDYSLVRVIDLLRATNDRSIGGVLYDRDGDRDANDDVEEELRKDANSVYENISDDDDHGHDGDDDDDDDDDDHGGDDDHD